MDNGGNGDFLRIQDGIDFAKDGDTIRVWEGTYPENIDVYKKIMLIGNGSLSRIWGHNTINIVNISSESVEVSGFAIKGDDVFCKDCSYVGIFVSANTVTIQDNYILAADIGINLYESQDIKIINNTFEDNLWSILVSNSRNINIKANNCSGQDIGIYVYNSQSSFIFGKNDIQFSDKAGILIEKSKNTYIDDTQISYNHIGIHIIDSIKTTFNNNNFHENWLDFKIEGIENTNENKGKTLPQALLIGAVVYSSVCIMGGWFRGRQ